jgi:hypothetical protein
MHHRGQKCGQGHALAHSAWVSFSPLDSIPVTLKPELPEGQMGSPVNQKAQDPCTARSHWLLPLASPIGRSLSAAACDILNAGKYNMVPALIPKPVLPLPSLSFLSLIVFSNENGLA